MKLVEKGLFRGGKPDLMELVINKVRIVINLETGIWEILTGKANEEAVFYFKYRINFLDFALRPWAAPDPEVVRACLEIMHHREGIVYVHCRHGRERTGFVIAAYRIAVLGWSFKQAYTEMVNYGCRWPYRILWKQALRRYEILSSTVTSTKGEL